MYMDCDGRHAHNHTQLSRHSLFGWRSFILIVPQSPSPPAQVTIYIQKNGGEGKNRPIWTENVNLPWAHYKKTETTQASGGTSEP